MMNSTINLLTQPWIQVIENNGRFSRIGLVSLFERASDIRELAFSNPMDRFATMRFLSSIIWWLEGNPSDANQLDTSRIANQLQEHVEKFNLFGSGSRIFQGTKAIQPATSLVLLHEIPSGANFWHFNHVRDNEDGLCSSCCVLGILRLPVFAWGGKGPGQRRGTGTHTGGVNGTPPIYYTLLGKNLQDTLSLNWKPLGNLGEPIWADHPEGALRTLTELPRKILLSDAEWRAEDQHCASCAANVELIFSCKYDVHKVEAENWKDPNILYDATNQTADPEKRIFGNKFNGVDRSLYRFMRILESQETALRTNKAIQLLLTGFSLHQAKFVDVWEQRIILPINDQPTAEKAALFGSLPPRPQTHLVFDGHSKHGELKSLVRDIRLNAEKGIVESLIDKPDKAFEKVKESYRRDLSLISQSLVPGYTASDVRRRDRMERYVIDPQLIKAKKTDAKTKKAKITKAKQK